MRSALPGWLLFCFLLLLCNTDNQLSMPPDEPSANDFIFTITCNARFRPAAEPRGRVA